jgi:hypothetical protein
MESFIGDGTDGKEYAAKQRMLHFRFLPQDEFMAVQLTGLVSLEAWEKVLRELEQALKGAPSDRLVANLSGLVGWLGIPERTAVGALMASHLVQMKKIALVIEQQKITGVVEAEAQRNGLDLRLFSSYEDAVSWALS